MKTALLKNEVDVHVTSHGAAKSSHHGTETILDETVRSPLLFGGKALLQALKMASMVPFFKTAITTAQLLLCTTCKSVVHRPQ